MKKLHSFALYALLAPAITLSSAAVLAQQSTGQDLDEEQQSSQHQPGSATQSTPGAGQAQTAAERRNNSGQSPALTATDRQTAGTHSRMENRGYLDAAPANGMHATNLIGAEVKSSTDEDLGEVSDLVINESGQVVAIVVGVGGFLGMGEKDVAIGWDEVTKSGTSDDDEHELQVSLTRESLMDAPEFEIMD